MTSTPDAFQLCSRCKDFDLSTILAPEKHPDRWHRGYLRESCRRFKLGPLNSLYFKIFICSFCKSVCETLEEQIDAKMLIDMRRSHLGHSCDLVWDRQVRTGLSGQQSSVYRLDIALLYFDSEDRDERIISINLQGLLQPSLWPVPQLGSCGRPSQFWNSSQSGRIRPPFCQPDILQTWLHKCESRHTGCWWAGPKVLLRLRFFDVKFRCIRNFQVSQDESVRYVTLSYVWGSQAQCLTLTKVNCNTLCNKQTIELGQLSRTISDAATVVEMLGERFLWVDALCIIQDDPDDLATQIPVMGQIYARSILTIVAAASNDTSSGLPGIDPQARSFQRNSGPLRGGTLLRMCTPKPESNRFHGYQHYLTNSKWNNRGWTFQEKMLSRRCLFFMEEQVYWECQCASWCEETCLEAGPVTRCIWPGKPMFFSNEDFPAGQRMLGEDSTRPFSDLVREYTSRSLTFERDSYKAFSGLVQILEQLTGAKFLHGIPVPDFNRSLFWLNRVGSSLRSGEHFPSWSWLAWTHSIELTPMGSLNRVEEIKCYCLCSDSSGRKQIVPVSDSLHLQCNHRTIKAHEIGIHSWSKLRNGFHILFWAMSAVLDVVDGGYNIRGFNIRHITPESNPPKEEYSDIGHMVGSEGFSKGAHEFVLIESEPDRYDCPDVVHLLMISWQDGIAIRLGAAKCRARAWEKAMPQRKLIIMG